jgi:hypothetical protein
MRFVPLSAIFFAASCGAAESDPPTNATPTEVVAPAKEASLAEVREYLACMRPVIERAKTNKNLSDTQVEQLGYACGEQLDIAATKIASLSSDNNTSETKKYLAGIAWCKLRECPDE